VKELAGSSDAAGKVLIVRVDARTPPAKGEVIHLRVRENEDHLFSPSTGERIGA
jgi:multiple sugar transport system ATP-binding protein